MKKICAQCGNDKKELRPYGPNSSMICFPCMMSSRVLQKEAEKNFSMQLDACRSYALVGSEDGPIPFIKENLN